MNILKYFIKITGHFLFVIIFIFFSTSQAKNLDKFNNADNIADYFSGILLLNSSKYNDSFNHFKRLDGLEDSHRSFSSNYLYSLINSGNFNRAFKYSKKLDRENIDNFESNLILGIYYLKNSKFDLSSNYFLKAKKRNPGLILNNYLGDTLYIWSNLHNVRFDQAINNLNELDGRFENLKKIQNVFLNCFFNNKETQNLYKELISDKKIDFSRYSYFYAKYLNSIGEKKIAKKIIIDTLKTYPRNLLLNQYKLDLERPKETFDFNCREKTHVVAEIIYITANALSSQTFYKLSNFYLNLSKYLNQDFLAYDTLLAENFYKIKDFDKSKKIYEKLINYGNAFKWYSNQQISRILIQEEQKEKSLKLLSKSFNELSNKGVYETFDYAEFLKNNEEFDKSIIHYTNILNKINEQHPLFSEATDGRGVAYERIGKWDEAEKDLLASLKVNPDQAYVINYLAYSWIEQGVKIEKSLKMLEKANKLKSNDPFIIDSLGWALFKLERYKESKDYLQLAVKLMPADPIVNDHYGDVLWKNGERIQARYYWKYVLNLEKAENDLKDIIEKKLVKGL